MDPKGRKVPRDPLEKPGQPGHRVPSVQPERKGLQDLRDPLVRKALPVRPGLSDRKDLWVQQGLPVPKGPLDLQAPFWHLQISML